MCSKNNFEKILGLYKLMALVNIQQNNMLASVVNF
ncbi:unnamed protein product [Paramecium sonneborni]|uniref:Uncharacterized protein n=1 Tax=Paramecium sonneborni TaxID=65129 RepID=A0A8S1RQD0_9CILI|nr:unnamed protein product [Paramecium sonneborni]CAD8129430.1 unnamed protein product [Paramecium sonneborni]